MPCKKPSGGGTLYIGCDLGAETTEGGHQTSNDSDSFFNADNPTSSPSSDNSFLQPVVICLVVFLALVIFISLFVWIRRKRQNRQASGSDYNTVSREPSSGST